METLNEFMIRRKAEINEEIARLRAELRQITAAEASCQTSSWTARTYSSPREPETIKEQVVKILADSPSGLTAKQIQAELNRRFKREVKRESLSPQLSRLGAEGVITRDGKTWILPIVENALKGLQESIVATNTVDWDAISPIDSLNTMHVGAGFGAKAENPQE